MEAYHIDLKRVSVHGAFYLTIRRVLLLVTAFLSNIVLAHILLPKDFGLFVFVSFIVSFFYTVGELGLNSAIIQKNKEVSNEELNTIFFIILSIGVIFTIFLYFSSTPLFILFPTYSSKIILVMRLMSLSLLVSILSVVPMALLERRMLYKKISIIEIVSTILYQISAMIFAIVGFGVMSFVYSYLILVVTSTFLAFVFSRWIPEFSINLSSVKKLTRFGLAYQVSNIIGVIKDSSTPFLAGVLVGAQGLGYLDWAKNTTIVSSIVTDGYGRVAFSAMSKIQDDNLRIQNSIEKSVRILTFVTFPLTFALIFFAKDIIVYVYTDKWLPALPALYLFALSTLTVGVSIPAHRALLSIGKSVYIFKSSILLLVLEWGLGLVMIIYFGYNGIAITSIFVAFIISYVYLRYLKICSINPSIWISINRNLLISILNLVLIFLLSLIFPSSLIYFFVLAFFYVLLYLMFSVIANNEVVNETLEIVKLYFYKTENKQ